MPHCPPLSLYPFKTTLLLILNLPFHPLSSSVPPLQSVPFSSVVRDNFRGFLVLIVVVDQSYSCTVCPLVTLPHTTAEGISGWQLPLAKWKQTKGQSGWWDRREEQEGSRRLYGHLSQFQPWETAGLPLTSWLVRVSSVAEDQILGLEHAQRLWDLARIEASYHSPIINSL